MRREWRVFVLLSPALCAGCAYLTPPIPNPDRAAPEALTLEYVLDRGCFAYLLDGKSETAAMRGLRLNHMGPGLSLTPPGPPSWRGGYAGLSNVVVGRDSCSVNMRGRDSPDYRAATQTVLRRRFGPEISEDGRSGYRAWLPGQVTACRRGLRYTYYENARGTIFSVDINRVDCGRDPLRPNADAHKETAAPRGAAAPSP